MSTVYDLHGNLGVTEASTKVQFHIDDNCVRNESDELGEEELRTVIVKLVHILSYISDDPSEALTRFNVDYRDTR